MKRFVPRWIRIMPLGKQISPLWLISLFTAILGVAGVAVGLVTGSADGLLSAVAVVPFLLLTFLLRRTYIDDGYQATPRETHVEAKRQTGG